MGRLYIIIGCPRSGKSTIVNKWLNFEFNIRHNRIWQIWSSADGPVINDPRFVVCSDDIRIALHGCRWSSVAEDMVHAVQGVMIRALLRRGDVIVDGTNTTKSSLKRLLSFDICADFFIVDSSIETCKQRATATNQEDLYPVIDRAYAQLSEWKDDPFTFIDAIREEVRIAPKPRIAV